MTPIDRWLATLTRRSAGTTDADLLGRFVASRDEEAFAELVRRYGPLVLGVCRRRVPDGHAAEDAFQAVFVVLAAKAGRIDSARPLGPWLHGVAVKVAARAGRRLVQRRRREVGTRDLPEVAAAVPAFDDATAALDEELARLSATYREALVLCELQGLSRRAAACRLGIAEGTLSSRLAAGRKDLARRLARRGVGPLATLVGASVSPDLAEAATRCGFTPASAAVSELSQGVLHAMLLTKLKVLTAVAAAGLVALPVVWAQVPAPAPVPPPRVAGAEKPVPSPPDRPVGLPADWTMVKELPLIVDPLGGPGAAAERLALRVEQGWLVVRLETTTGHLQWEVVLARATDPTPPAVEADPKFRGIYVQYGPYLVRENLGRLRVYRERKTPDSAAWPIPKAVAGEQFDSKCGTIDVTLAGDWYWLTAGAIADKPDVRVRFQHKDLLGDGKGVQSFRAFKENLNYVTFGKNAVCYDEGDLLHGFRIPPYNAVNDIAWEKMKVEFGTKPPPALDGKTWFNTPAPLSLDGLKGKVVLLDFWGQWCLPCVKNLPKVGELHTKYKDRGLVVIGVHSQDQSEKLDEFLTEKKVPFPVLIDSGKTAAQYPIGGWPTYFLLDKAGNVVYGPSNDPPSEAEVEKQLAK